MSWIFDAQQQAALCAPLYWRNGGIHPPGADYWTTMPTEWQQRVGQLPSAIDRVFVGTEPPYYSPAMSLQGFTPILDGTAEYDSWFPSDPPEFSP